MFCIYCGADTRVTNSRRQKRNNQIWRRRKCTDCGAIFTSHEALDLSTGFLVGSEKPQPFVEDKLYSDLLDALKDHNDSYTAAREATYTVIGQLLKSSKKPQFSKEDISRAAAGVLERLDQRAYLRYRAEYLSHLQ